MTTCNASGHRRWFVFGPRLGDVAEVWIVRVSIGLCAAAAAIPGWRRIVGALVRPPGLGTSAAVATAFGLFAAAGLGMLQFRGGAPDGSSARRRTWGVLLVAAIGMAAALSIPGTAWSAVTLLWLPTACLLAAGGCSSRFGCVGVANVVRRVRLAGPTTVDEVRTATLDGEFEPSKSAAGAEQAKQAEQLVSQFVRRRKVSGGETVEGRLVAPFEPGRRVRSLHVSFCPPLSASPVVRWKLEGEVEAEVKLVQRLPYGARFDVRLPEPAEDDCTVELSFTAVVEDVGPTAAAHDSARTF